MHRLLRTFLSCSLSCSLSAALSAAPTEHQLMATMADELPEYTIAREFDKYRAQYPYIRPIASSQSDAFSSHSDLVYRRLGQRALRLDLFQPNATPTPAPAVVLVHGGGWRSGDRSHQVPMAQALATAGFVGVAVEYRLSREALYPAGLDDIQAAIRWLRQHSQQYGIDPTRIAVLGASSGAHMATLLGSSGHLPEPQDKDSQVQAIINLDGVVDLASAEARVFEDKPGKVSYAGLWLGGRYAEQPARWHEASPSRYAGPQTPPTLFINSAQPRFHVGRDQFVATLAQHGIYTEVHTLADTPHTFWLFHPWFDNTRDLVVGFLNRVFRGQPQLQGYRGESFSEERIEALAPGQRQQWRDYLHNSRRIQAQDAARLAAEVIAQGRSAALDAPILDKHNPYQYDPEQCTVEQSSPGPSNSGQSNPKLSHPDRANREQTHCRSARTGWLDQRVVANILSWQTPSGGWSKGTDIYSQTRQPGQHYGVETHYVPTFDNNATFTQIRLLAEAYRDTPTAAVAQGLQRALQLLLDAQFPNGGWPQTFPLAGSYHDWTTYNDGVIANMLNLYQDILADPDRFAADDQLQARVRASLEAGVENVLADQRTVSADSAGWGQQHDPLTHQLRPARAFEMAALATMESADLLRALMRIEQPSDALQTAIRRGILWLQQTRLDGRRWQRYPDRASSLVADPGAAPLWPRMIDATSGAALFGDRDGSIHTQVGAISIERQLEYAWYHSSPAKALDDYSRWQANNSR
ncbi:MAG: pectate lyase [Gammaproteobacteria bacterium]|nr:pectate lyase [Gammaproteobacteria bacterium]